MSNGDMALSAILIALSLWALYTGWKLRKGAKR
ncbi:hypothetical protein LCGC14_1372320 [marine sediment metagenome]|uniref:Uncharacterized protein n=1 Tax=marine sediment metagenome TaxID=412755 RepID=A0A0F9KR15_9ZZZZ